MQGHNSHVASRPGRSTRNGCRRTDQFHPEKGGCTQGGFQYLFKKTYSLLTLSPYVLTRTAINIHFECTMSDKNTICGPSGAVAPETESGPRVEDNAVEQNVTQEQPQNSVVIKEVTDENLRAALMELLEKSDLNVTTGA